MAVLELDFETISLLDLRKVGTHEYFAHPSTRIIMMAYAFDDEPVHLWLEGEPLPHAIREHIRKAGEMRAFNASFESTAWEVLASRRMGWPVVLRPQWVCTMVEARSMGFPGSLEDCAQAMKLDVQKDKEGKALMLRMTRPRSNKNGVVRWWHEEDPEKFARLGEYCMRDVETSREIRKRLSRLRPSERRLWLIDQDMNKRGIRVDREAAFKLSEIVTEAKRHYDHKSSELTGGAVKSLYNFDKIKMWLAGKGVQTASLDRPAVRALLDDPELPKEARSLLDLKQKASKSSVAKVGVALLMSASDGRIRNNIQFYGADTGRDAGRAMQLQNLPRGSLKADKVAEFLAEIKRHKLSIEEIETRYGSALDVVSSCLRGLLIADGGKRLIAADLSNIEGRVGATLAGEAWKVQAFRDFDLGIGPDIYKLTGSKIYNVPIEAVDDKIRQVGKTAELALLFGSGVPGLSAMAANYGLKEAQFEELYVGLAKIAGNDTVEYVIEAYESRGKDFGWSRRAWMAAELIKVAWRAQHPATVRFWKALQEAAKLAVSTGEYVNVGDSGIAYVMDGEHLNCYLPSGRPLIYPYAVLEREENRWGSEQTLIKYSTQVGPGRVWSRTVLTATITANNVTQATARDIFKEAQIRLVDKGYHPVLDVHDEHVFEERDGFGSLDEVIAEMCDTSGWRERFPIAAAGFEATRYRK